MTTIPNPTSLTTATRFRPTHVRAHSRSPSRSPVRKAQFTAQHLDPLLRNLSPDSTLKALQTTETITTGSGEDALTTSIADTTPAEREIGIRAAFAAQKLREWRGEISKWQWPSRREGAFGAGFLPPQDIGNIRSESEKPRIYLGYLPVEIVDQYEQRIDEIRDALETLEMEDIKDHVLQAHASATLPKVPPAPTERRSGARKSYGRMRDFTALITATVIQALPDLALVSMLIDTWDVRLTVLRDLPMLLDTMKATRAGIRAATAAVRDPAQTASITVQDFETTKKMLGDKVADLGGRIDRLLDLLEGQEDALPQSWIDSLETIELDYATWVVETQRIATHNQSGANQIQAETPAKNGTALNKAPNEPVVPSAGALPTEVLPPSIAQQPVSTAPAASNLAEKQSSGEDHRPVLRLKPPVAKAGHRREISEVSVAESAYSAYSDVSRAEIVDATQTQLLPGPKVSVVDSPAREKPPMLQRASTASIEIVSKDQLKRVDLRRSMSADLFAKSTHSPDSTPSKALEQLTGRPRTGTTPIAELEDPTSTPYRNIGASEALDLSRTLSNSVDGITTITPILPRKSSRRKSADASLMLGSSERSSSPSELVSPIEAQPAYETRKRIGDVEPDREVQFNAEQGSLEAKIQDILLKLPTKIRLTKNGEEPHSTGDSSMTSTRSSTPTPALTLSPVKPSRRNSTNDTDVRVFHLKQHGQARDAAPIKLFVRTVGENGERVMVRVGGGWADLGEYLKEYSLHHGRRSVSEAQLEVAQYPVKQRKESGSAPGPSRKASQTHGRSRSPSPPRSEDEGKVWTPPPVPPIPAGYTVRSPTLTSISRPNGIVETMIQDSEAPPLNNGEDYFNSKDSPVAVRTHTATAPGVTTTTTVAMPPNPKNASYTPLGAAGPKASARRAVTFGEANNANSDAWVEGVVGKARAVSSNVVQGPTTTTTTTVTSSAPASRRASAMMAPTLSQPKSKPIASAKESEQVGRRRSILGLGDVGGIKRVFLRRKGEK